MSNNPKSPFSPLRFIGTMAKALVLLTGLYLLSTSTVLSAILFSESAPHTMNSNLDFINRPNVGTNHDKVTQKPMVDHFREAVSKQNRTTFKFAILSPTESDNVQLYCTALESFEARVAIKNILGEEMTAKEHRFEKGKVTLRFDVSTWAEGKYIVHIHNEGYNRAQKFEVSHSAKAKFASNRP